MSDVIATRIWNILHTRLGVRNAIKGRDLAVMIGLRADKTGERTVQKAIEQLRKQHRPIAACDQGYFIPLTNEEKRAYLRSFDARIESMCVARSMAAKAMGIPPVEQIPLFGPDGRRSA